MFNKINKEEQSASSNKPAVIVHIWTSEHNLRKKGMHKGSVSLELTGDNKAYLSGASNPAKANEEEAAACNTCFADDVQSLGRKPEYSFHFYDLNQKLIANMLRTGAKKELKVEPKDSANHIWTLLEAGNIEQHIPSAEKLAGYLQAKLDGKVHKLQGDAVIVGNVTAAASKLTPIFFNKPEHKAIGVGIAAAATAAGGVSKMAPKEVQDHPLEAFMDGGHYALAHTIGLLKGHKTPDNLVTLLPPSLPSLYTPKNISTTAFFSLQLIMLHHP